MSTPRMTKTDVPGVYRRGDKYVYTYRKRGQQRWGTARTKAEARRLKRNAETDVERGEHRDLARASFGEYARDWIEHYRGRTSSGVRESTRRWYRQMLEDRLIPNFELDRGLRLAEIEPRDIKAAIAGLSKQPNPHDPERTLGRSTIGYHVAVLRALFADAVEEGVIRSNPTTSVRVAVANADDDDEPAKAMTRAELGRVLDEVGERWRTFFEFLTYTGLRISEAVELRWRDLDLSLVPRLTVRRQLRDGQTLAPKTAAGRRTIPLSTGMAKRLRATGPTGRARLHDDDRPTNQPLEPLARRPPSCRRACGRAMGFVPHVPPHVRVAALRRRQERQAGPGLDRPL